MHKKQYASLHAFLNLCKRNNLDVTAENFEKSNGDSRGVASRRKKNRTIVAKMAHCSPSAVRSWVMDASPIPMVYYDLLSRKWDDQEGIYYANQDH